MNSNHDTKIRYYEEAGVEMVNINGKIETKEKFMDQYQAIFSNNPQIKDEVDEILDLK